MAKYSYNGTVLPELPDASGHKIIWYDKASGCYILACAKSYIANSNTICVLPDETVTVYAAVGNEWVSATWDKNQDVDDLESLYPDLVFFLGVKGLAYTLWANTNIYYVDVEDGEIKTTTQVAFEGTTPEYYSPDIPVAGLCFTRNGKDYAEAVIALEEPGWHTQGQLVPYVTERESGVTREIVWYVNGSVWEDGWGSSKPICDAVGTYAYYITVTDTGPNGVSVSDTSDTVTLEVRDFDLSTWGTDDFDGDSDMVSPGTGSGSDSEGDSDSGSDSETETQAEVPAIESCGANSMYSKGENAHSLVCVASVSDGGELSYEWYEDGEPAYDTAEITPTTEEYGKKRYFCIVTNTLNGSTASAVSDVITITVWSHKRFQSGIVAGLACDGWHMGETAEEETEVDPFLQGVEIGRKLKAARLVQGEEPIAYLYDGEQFPLLPKEMVNCPYLILTGKPGVTYVAAYSYLDKPVATGKDFWGSTYKIELDPDGAYYHALYGRTTGAFDWYNVILNEGTGTVYANEIYWANFDIYSPQGELLFAKSDEPIPVYKTWGNCSFNGAILPEFPKRDASIYRYALIRKQPNSDYYYLLCSSEKAETLVNEVLGTTGVYVGAHIQYRSNRAGTVWSLPYSSSGTNMALEEVVWSNQDVLNADGTVYLPASEPIPIYE